MLTDTTPRERAKIWLIVAVVVLGGLYLLSNILFPFILGMVVAYMLDPLCDRMEARGMGRGAATGLLVGGFVLFVVVVLGITVPLLWSEAAALAASLPKIENGGANVIEPVRQTLSPYLPAGMIDRLDEAASTYIAAAAGWLGSGVRAAVQGSLVAFDVLSTALITPLVSFYLIRDWDNLVAAIDERIPRPAVGIVRRRCREIDEVLSAWLRGVATVCGILAAFYATALGLLGVQHGILIGAFAGAISFIPFVGFFAGGIPALISAFITFPADQWYLWVATGVIFFVGQVVEGNILTPKLVGQNVDLHEAWVLFALMAGGAVLGFTGVLVAIPLAAAIGVLVRATDGYYLQSRMYDPNNAAAGDAEASADERDAA